MPRSDYTICTSGQLPASITVSHDFAVTRYSSPPFGSHDPCTYSEPCPLGSGPAAPAGRPGDTPVALGERPQTTGGVEGRATKDVRPPPPASRRHRQPYPDPASTPPSLHRQPRFHCARQRIPPGGQRPWQWWLAGGTTVSGKGKGTMSRADTTRRQGGHPEGHPTLDSTLNPTAPAGPPALLSPA